MHKSSNPHGIEQSSRHRCWVDRRIVCRRDSQKRHGRAHRWRGVRSQRNMEHALTRHIVDEIATDIASAGTMPT